MRRRLFHYLRLHAALLGAPAALQRMDAETWSHQIWISVRKESNSNTLNNKHNAIQLRAAVWDDVNIFILCNCDVRERVHLHKFCTHSVQFLLARLTVI